MGAMPVGCYKQMSAIKEGVIMRLRVYPMFIEPTITWVPSGFSEYIWLDTKIVLKNYIAIV